MNIETGEIRRFATREEARAAGFELDLTEDQVRELENLPPEDRLRRMCQPEERPRRKATEERVGMSSAMGVAAMMAMVGLGGPVARVGQAPERGPGSPGYGQRGPNGRPSPSLLGGPTLEPTTPGRTAK